MKAMVLSEICDLNKRTDPLKPAEMPKPEIRSNEILVKVSACGVCHTELDEIEGRTPPKFFPMILGHQIVGTIVACADSVSKFTVGDRVGIAWIFSSCGSCPYCKQGNENLCSEFQATGRDAHGGYAEYIRVSENFAFPIPDMFEDIEAAPLLCAGAIGYRSVKLTNLNNGENLGLMGFGASAHLVLKLVSDTFPDSRIFVFARSPEERRFALELGAEWAGDIDTRAPVPLQSIIDTTPVWKTVVESMRNLAPGGRLVINAIRKENIDKDYLLKLNYAEHLWMEKEIKSVANVAVNDVAEFLEAAARIPIKSEVQVFPLSDANRALMELKNRKIRGAKVLKIS